MKQYIKLIIFRQIYVYIYEQKSRRRFRKFQQNYSLTQTSETHICALYIPFYYNFQTQ